MRLIIDIPEDVYTRLFDNGIQDNEIAVDDICEMARSLRLGTPIPDNATNGEVVKFIFKNTLDNFIDRTTWVEWYRWWNAPYQKGGKE